MKPKVVIIGCGARGGETYGRYFVQSGDTVWDLAKRYRTDCEKIIALNKLDNTRLLAGQKILIPGM